MKRHTDEVEFCLMWDSNPGPYDLKEVLTTWQPRHFYLLGGHTEIQYKKQIYSLRFYLTSIMSLTAQSPIQGTELHRIFIMSRVNRQVPVLQHTNIFQHM